MLYKLLLVCGKFKFCFGEISGILKKYFQSMVGWLHVYRTLRCRTHRYEGWAIQMGLPFKPLYIGRGILKTIGDKEREWRMKGRREEWGEITSQQCKRSVWPTSLEVGHWRTVALDCGKEGRGHCQSPAEDTMSFKHKMQWFGAKDGENPWQSWWKFWANGGF